MTFSCRKDPQIHLGDQQEIYHVIASYCRALDRLDGELLTSLFLAGATIETGVFNGVAEDFYPWAIEFFGSNMRETAHTVANCRSVVDGETAFAESYLEGFSIAGEEGNLQESLYAGRFYDRLERDNGVWKIAERKMVLDWSHRRPSVPNPDDPLVSQLRIRGSRGGEDPVYEVGGWSRGERNNHGAETKVERVGSEVASLIYDKVGLRELSLLYATGIDRQIPEILDNILSNDASLRIEGQDLSGASVGKQLCGLFQDYDYCTHRIMNSFVQPNGGTAVGETYAVITRGKIEGETDHNEVLGGRFLDRFRKVDGAWKISSRVFVVDWSWEEELPAPAQPPQGGPVPGMRSSDDPGFAYLPAGWAKPKMTPEQGAMAESVAEKSRIEEVLLTYARGVDRRDTGIMKSSYHPEATDNHGIYEGNAWEFVDFLLGGAAPAYPSIHAVSNVLISRDGTLAKGESFLVTFTLSGEPREAMTCRRIGGRYLDFFEKREGEWRIIERTFVLDYSQQFQCGEGAIMARLRHSGNDTGRCDEKDQSYSYLLQ